MKAALMLFALLCARPAGAAGAAQLDSPTWSQPSYYTSGTGYGCCRSNNDGGSFTVADLDECKTLCINDPSCQSIDYYDENYKNGCCFCNIGYAQMTSASEITGTVGCNYYDFSRAAYDAASTAAPEPTSSPTSSPTSGATSSPTSSPTSSNSTGAAPTPSPPGCKAQAEFDIMMCKSHMCTDCKMEWCMTTCQQLQDDYPACKCEHWDADTYSAQAEHAGKGVLGDSGDYSRPIE